MRAMQDAWRAYLELALGLTEASRKRATKVVKQMIGKGGATAEQLQALAEDLVKTSTANREAMTKLVRYELDRALGVVGLATAEEVADLTSRVRDLEQQLREAEARAAGIAEGQMAGLAEVTAAAAATRAARTAAPARGAAPKKAAARKAAATKAAATGAGSTGARSTRAVATKAVAKKAVAKKTPAKKTVAKKSPAQKVVVKKSATKTAAKKGTAGGTAAKKAGPR
jgi:polyhydroxyalkanoate synthesis regulator phasin